AIIFSGNATSYSWTNSDSSIGLSATGTGDIAAFAGVNTSTTPVTATIVVTPHYDNASVDCAGATQTFTITVNPTPTVEAVASQTYCEGDVASSINFDVDIIGATINWTSTSDVGFGLSGTGNIGAYIATNTSRTTNKATITVTPSTGYCIGEPIDFDITVNPTFARDETEVVNISILTSDLPFTYGDSVFYAAGTKDIIYKTISGCDSTVVVNLHTNSTYAVNDINVTYVDMAVSGNVLTNDFDLEGDSQRVTAQTTTVAGGTLELKADGSYTFIPASGFEGEVVFNYEVCDNGSPKACDQATLTIRVLPGHTTGDKNTVTAIDDAVVVEEGQSIVINVLGNDFDLEGNNFSITALGTPSCGSVSITTNGKVSFVPDAACSGLGEVTFTYTICDDGTPQACDQATVTITIIPDDGINSVYAVDDAYNGNYGAAISGNVTGNDYDPEGGVLTVNTVPVTGVAHGTLVLNGDGSFSYQPTGGFTGTDSFVYEVCDNGTPRACDQATVYLTVNPEKTTPQLVIVARPDVLDIIYCRGGDITGNINLLANDEDIEGDVTISVDRLPENVSLNLVNGYLSYESSTLSAVSIQFSYTVCSADDLTNCSSAEVIINIHLDSDCDGVVDADDIDDDDDGILDTDEERNATNQLTLDSDGDGIVDRLDIDSDGDGIVDNIEWQAEDGSYRDPVLVDTDGDGWDDAYDPDNGGSYPALVDTDGDGTYDYLDLNSDDDPYLDWIEGNDGNYDQTADFGPVGVDSDHDGLDDGYDNYNMSGNIPKNSGDNAIGSNAALGDGDHNGVRDWRDPYQCELVVPEIFSPNGDGIQDYFRIHCIDNYPEAEIRIFNRWGNQVYRLQRYGNAAVWGETEAWWDGKVNDKGALGTFGSGILPSATYFYLLDLGDGKKPVSGFVFLKRE
ncbi:MAG: Ig-like domain-containing protein, partial [Mangrovibacterium sp.]